MAENFYTILTATGKAKLANSAVLGSEVNFKTLRVGDGNGNYYEPTENQTSLVNEVWEGNISSIYIDEKNPNWIVTETVISATQGGFFIREAGIFDEDGDLIAVSKLSETYKPIVSEGSTKDLYIKIILEVNNVNSVTLKIDPTDIVLTNKDIQMLESKILLIDSELNTPTYSKYVTTFNEVTKLNVENNKQIMVDIEGNTIVNLLDNHEDFEDISKWNAYQCALSLDNNNKVFGNNGMKITLATSTIGNNYKEITQIIDTAKYYCLSGYCKNGNANIINIGFYNGLTSAACGDVSGSDNFVRTWLKLKPGDYGATINQIVCTVVGTSEQYGYFDGLMLEEITAEQYNDSNFVPSPYINGDMSVGEIATKIKTRGKNLLPNIICWSKIGMFSQIEFPTNDSLQIPINSSCTASVSMTIPVEVNTTYSFSYICDILNYIDKNGEGAYYNIYGMTDLLTKSGTIYNSKPYAKNSGINNISKTFTTGANEKYICVVLGVDKDYGTFVFDKVQLEEGSVVTPYEPYEETYLNIDRPLRSLPCGIKDEIKDGKLIKRIEKLVLDGSLNWKVVLNNSGIKTIECCLPVGTIQNYNFESYKTGARFLKYNNKEISRGDSTNTERAWIIGASDYTHIRLEIYSTDSGWGDSYVPTSDEIKAYFYGFKMCNSSDGTVYSGTGIKSWGNVNKEVNGTIPWTTNTSTLPTTTTPGYTPYRLYYQLSTPVVTELNYPNLVAFPKGNLIMESDYQSWVRSKITYKIADNEKANMDEVIKFLSKNTLQLSEKANKSDVDYTTLGLSFDIAKTNFKLDTYTGAIKNNLTDMVIDVLNDDNDIDKTKSQAYGFNKNISYIPFYKYNSKSYIKNGVTIIDDFAGKVSGDVTDCPSIGKYNKCSNLLLTPDSSDFIENSQTDTDKIMTSDSDSFGVTSSGVGYTPQSLFSFNLIRIIEDKYGTLPCASDIESKVEWLKANIDKITCNWYGCGSYSGGNKAYMKTWINSDGGWSNTIITNTSTTSSLLQNSITTASSIMSIIDLNGFIHFLTYTNPCNGIVASTIYTEYVNMEITLISPTGYDFLVPFNNRRDSGLDTIIKYKQDSSEVNNFMTAALIQTSLIQYLNSTDVFWKTENINIIPNKVWILVEQDSGTNGTISYQISRDNGITFTNISSNTLVDISSQPVGKSVVVKSTISGDAKINSIVWGWK